MKIPGVESPLSLRLAYDKRLRVYLYSEELPPLMELGGSRAEGALKILCGEFECWQEGSVRKAVVPPVWMPPVLIWLAAVPAVGPDEALLKKLMSRTPKSAFMYVLELREPAEAYARGRPMIPPAKLQQASHILVKMLNTLIF